MKLKPLIHLTVKGVGIKRRDLDKIKEELSTVSLRTFISIEEVEAAMPSAGKVSYSGVEEIISSLLPGMSNIVIELYRAFRAGDLHAELDKLFNSDEWLKVDSQQISAEPPTKSLKPPSTSVTTKSSSILRWLIGDNREG